MPAHKTGNLVPFTRGSDRGEQGSAPVSIPGQPASVTAAAWYGMVTGDEIIYGVPAQVVTGTEAIPGWVILIPPRELYWRAELDREDRGMFPEWMEE